MLVVLFLPGRFLGELRCPRTIKNTADNDVIIPGMFLDSGPARRPIPPPLDPPPPEPPTTDNPG